MASSTPYDRPSGATGSSGGGPERKRGGGGPARACVECRRLKRKCNLRFPCQHCLKNDKECEYATKNGEGKSRRSYTARLEERIRELETTAPQQDEPPMRRSSVGFEATFPGSFDGSGVAPSATGPSSAYGGSNALADASSILNPPIPEAGPSQSSPPIVAPTFGASPTSYASTGYPTAGPPSNQSSTDPTLASFVPLPLGAPPPTFLPPTLASSVPLTSSSEALEKQPRNASGYEWTERNTISRQSQDGTASLSLEPDGQGYLGFASGATLLRILQIIAGVSHIEVPPPTTNKLTNWNYDDREIDELLDAYFKYYHVQYPILHESTFRAQIASVIPPPSGPGWEILTNVVLALGAFVSFRPMEAVDYFLERALAHVNVDCLEVGNLTLVQAFTLLSNITQKRNKPNAGSIYLGIATRMATSLGLHRELPSWNISLFEREVRRRIWWTVFCFDAGACITFGRPILLPGGEADVQMVHNVSDRAFTPFSTQIPPPEPGPTLYTSLAHQASFHRLGNVCYNLVISSPPPSSQDLLAMDSSLQRWRAGLPAWMQPTPEAGNEYPRYAFTAHKLWWRFSNLRLVLFRRAFLERALKGAPLAPLPGSPESSLEDVDATCAALCLQSAADTITAIHQFLSSHRSGPNRLEWWYGLHFLFHASFVPLIALHADPVSSSRSSWLNLVALTCTTLSILSTEPLAQRCLQIIEMLKPREDPNGSLQLDTGILAEMLARSEWAGPEGAQNWLPFADLATLSSFWPATAT